MCTLRPRNSSQSEVTGSSKKPTDYVLHSSTLDHMPETPLDVNNVFMHAWQSNTFDHMPPTSDVPVYQIDPHGEEERKHLTGSLAESFAQLSYYCHNLKMANEGTFTHIETDAEGRFKLLYVGFGVAIWAFLTSMRPFIIIDESYLNGTYEGTNLLAIGMDSNNQIVPIVTGMCQGDAAADELTEWAAAKVHRRKLKSAKKTTVRETYKELVYPLQGLSSWETSADKQNMLPPTMEKRIPRQPSNNDRFRSRGESRDKTPCGTCGKKEHKSMSCKGPKKIQSKRQQKIKRDENTCTQKEHINMNPKKIAEQNQGMSKYFLFEDNELTLIEDYDDSNVYNEDTYGLTCVNPDCYYEEVDAIN
nr:transposase, MuDR, MULE transposase domain protein [Tanacetum cinerariifolium]